MALAKGVHTIGSLSAGSFGHAFGYLRRGCVSSFAIIGLYSDWQRRVLI